MYCYKKKISSLVLETKPHLIVNNVIQIDKKNTEQNKGNVYMWMLLYECGYI